MKNKGNDDEYLNAIGKKKKKALEMQGLQQRDVLYLAKDKGYDIRTEMEEFTDRYGDKSRFARYYLIKEKK